MKKDEINQLVGKSIRIFGKTVKVKWVEWTEETQELNINDKIKLTGKFEEVITKLNIK